MNQWKLKKSELRLGIILVIFFILGGLSILPYTFELLKVKASINGELLFFNILNSIILGLMPIYLGILAKRNSYLKGTPWLEFNIFPGFSKILIFGFLVGFFLALSTMFFDFLFLKFEPKFAMLNQLAPSGLSGLLASFYGAINEEILIRFFFMSFLVKLLKRFGNHGIWVAIIITSLGFGFLHIPILVKTLELTSVWDLPLIHVVRILTLNGIGGFVFGIIFWQFGLEISMIAHFSNDIFLHGFFHFF